MLEKSAQELLTFREKKNLGVQNNISPGKEKSAYGETGFANSFTLSDKDNDSSKANNENVPIANSVIIFSIFKVSKYYSNS